MAAEPDEIESEDEAFSHRPVLLEEAGALALRLRAGPAPALEHEAVDGRGVTTAV